ncbi:hypothetical protein VNO77_11132 [Canavalia gladiata]|uniref:Uncharacterized protein n=1 Tax=Canavalia gladiata TaxID=3824 RepID=A0AAN9QY72_CANGL
MLSGWTQYYGSDDMQKEESVAFLCGGDFFPFTNNVKEMRAATLPRSNLFIIYQRDSDAAIPMLSIPSTEKNFFIWQLEEEDLPRLQNVFGFEGPNLQGDQEQYWTLRFSDSATNGYMRAHKLADIS